jgi:hypothetical protein
MFGVMCGGGRDITECLKNNTGVIGDTVLPTSICNHFINHIYYACTTER